MSTLPTRDSIRCLRRTVFASDVIERWRRLAPLCEGPTLVACSGGADSVALLLALASAEPEHVRVAHVVHDLRTPAQAEADEHWVRELSDALMLSCERARIETGEANAEGEARRERYEALEDIAITMGCPFVATGHHADDQLETFLFHAIRGAGPAGLSGIAETRGLGRGVRLVRPMLGVTHAEAEAFCREAGVVWREDATNHDTERTRARLRAEVVPVLRALNPDAARRVADGASLQSDLRGIVEERADAVAGEATEWARESLRGEPRIVVGQILRRAAVRVGCTRMDALTLSATVPAIHAVRDGSTEPRVFEWAQGVRVEVTSARVRVFRPPTGGA